MLHKHSGDVDKIEIS